MTTEESVLEFLTAGRANGWSDATVKQYTWHLAQLCARLPTVDPAALTRHMLRTWSADLRNDWEPATCRVAIIAARSWLRFCFAEGMMPADLSSSLKIPRTPARVQRTVQPDEVTALLTTAAQIPTAGLTPDQAHATAARNAALVVLMYDTILRAAEVCRLDLAHVDLGRQHLTAHGKGDKQAVVSFGPETTQHLQAWLNWRPTVATDPAALFVAVTGTRPGQRLTSNGLRVILRKLAARAGIPHLSPHAFRRGGAVQAIRNGAPSRVLQMHGRWEKLDMIETYTRQINAEQEMSKYRPMSGIQCQPEQ